MKPAHVVLMLAMNLIWGFNLVASKVGVTQFPPLLFTSLRFGLLALVLAPFLRIHRGQMITIVRMALLNGGLAFALLFTGMALTEDVTTVAIAVQLNVPFATVLSILVLGERVGWQRALGLVLAFGGVMVVGFDPRVFSYIDGLLLVVAAAFVGATGMLVMKRLHSINVFEQQAWLATLSLPLLLVLSFALEQDHLQAIGSAGWLGWGSVVFTALGASLIGHGGLYYLIQRYDVSLIAPLTLLSSVFAIVFGVTLLGDTLTPRMLIGGAITLGGVLMISLRQRGRALQTPT